MSRNIQTQVTPDICRGVNAEQTIGRTDPFENLTDLEKRLLEFYSDGRRFGCQHESSKLVVRLLTSVDVDEVVKRINHGEAIPPATKIQDSSLVVVMSNKSGHGLRPGRVGLFYNADKAANRVGGFLVNSDGRRMNSRYEPASPRDCRFAYPREIDKFFAGLERLSININNY